MLQGNYQKITAQFVTRLRARCRACGFTLVELMITLAVAAILAMIALPSFRHLLVSTNLSSINSDLTGDLQFARTTAVSRQVEVAVDASAGSWQNGWTVQIPAASSAAGAAPEVLRRHSGVSDNYVVSAATTSVAYQSEGALAGAAGTTACFTIYAPNGLHNPPLFIQVLSSGMVQQTSGTNPDTTVCPAAPTP